MVVVDHVVVLNTGAPRCSWTRRTASPTFSKRRCLATRTLRCLRRQVDQLDFAAREMVVINTRILVHAYCVSPVSAHNDADRRVVFEAVLNIAALAHTPTALEIQRVPAGVS
jgi:hypothetical protein